MAETNKIYQGDALEVLRGLPDGIADCCVTSPPYWGLRDYGVDGQLGLEKTPDEYVQKMVETFREARRVLRDDGTLWLNLGDSYACASGGGQGMNGRLVNRTAAKMGIRELKKTKVIGNLKSKDLVGIPWRVAFVLQADGWYLRSDIIWAKPNPMPESVQDRPTKAHEYLFLLAKAERYYYDGDSIRERTGKEMDREEYEKLKVGSYHNHTKDKKEGMSQVRKTRFKTMTNPLGRNKRDVWTINTKPFPEAHFAVFPEKLIEPCILAGSRGSGIVLDPFMGAGTTALVAQRLHRKYIGIEINPKYIKMAEKRLLQPSML